MFTLFYLLGILAGLVAIGWAWYQRGKGRQSRSWPNVSGTITASGVKEVQFIDEPTEYHPYVEYSYSVGGRAYQGTRIAFGGEQGRASRSTAAERVARYRPGRQVTVYYDPRYPESAVLQRTVPNVLVPLFVGVAMIATFGYFLFVYHFPRFIFAQ